jgi:UDP-N-acetylglucosamine 2-epimerase (non-hydrolysing)
MTRDPAPETEECLRVTCVVGARPNFVKAASIVHAARARSELCLRLVHTGQHYDERMSALFFRELGLPEPDAYLGVGSASHAVQTARVLEAFDAELDHHPADCVVVVGDVNSTLACALVAAKRGVRVAHVEAGLRSRDRSMPEEINRILTDQLSDDLFTTERSAGANLLQEGIPEERIHFVGNVMIDTLLRQRELARQSDVVQRQGLAPRTYAVCTLHRPSNTDTLDAANNSVAAIEMLSARLPVVFPVHPRTRARLVDFGLLERLLQSPGTRLIEPLGYLDFLALMDQARLIFTDSGGIQEETTMLGVPCLTFRDTTERPITVTDGTNHLVGLDPVQTGSAADAILDGSVTKGRIPELWDGQAAKRILQVLTCAPRWNRPDPAKTPARLSPDGCTDSSIST